MKTEVAMEPDKDKEKTRDYWLECRLIAFVDGKDWGLDEEGKTSCLGTEPAVLKAIETGELPDWF